MTFMNINYTPHSLKRINQRGISKVVIELILRYGKSFNSHNDKKFILPDKALRTLLKKHKDLVKYEEKIKNTCVIFNEPNVITTYKVKARLQWN